ncbi:hypothetical protein DU500_13965 [Haloplanus rubicundus]|uniref:Uncharacterized protein n=1 Tax=Haloplanus rubicundus TaxID=1547898 RepID=A0A345E5G9_9EURY|nr:hypothetical protein [Haloplanus rubicundus]AXG07441.1 hypothetical protein DU500_13965 [Haloplanus rubicundus]
MTDSHHNDERTVRCPIEGCDSTPLARGINLHIRQSSGDGHGPQGEVPDHIDLGDLETVGEREVRMDYPKKRDTEDVARLCPYCSLPYKGTNGVLIHLGQVAGRKNHPENAAQKHSEEDFPRVEVDEFENVTNVIDSAEDIEEVDSVKAAVPRQRVYRLIADFVADDEMQTARRVRKQLLGIDTQERSIRPNPTHPDLYSKLVEQLYEDQAEYEVAAALEKVGIMIASRGETGLYSADDALDLAASIERVAVQEGRNEGRVAGLIEFLRYGADLLERDQVGRNRHEELDEWL